MKNGIKHIFFISLMLLSLALPACGANWNLTIVDDRNWEEFDSKISPIAFQFNTHGGTQARTYAEWYSPYDTYYVSLSMPTYAEADVPQDMPGLLSPHVPSAWSGPVAAHIRHAYMISAYDGMAETMTMDFPPSGQDDTLVYRDYLGFRALFNKNTSFPSYPQNIPSTVPDYVLVVDKNGNTVWADVRMKQVVDTPETGRATYSGLYFPISGSVTWTKSQFPLRLYFLSLSTTQYEISSTVDSVGGTISPSGSVTVNHGEDASFIITTDDRYCITSLLIDGEAVKITDLSMMEYVFANVDRTHSIAVKFSKIDSLPEISADSGVTGSLVNLIESASDAVVAAFEKGGFTGGKTIHVVNLDKDTKMEGSFTADAGGFAQAVKLDVKYEEGSESKGLTLTVKPADAAKPFSTDKKYYALLLNKKTNYYDLFLAARNASGNLAVKIAPVGDYFSEGTVFIYSGTAVESETPVTPVDPTTPSGPKSGGGCTAGIGALALLALAPLYLRRKR